MNWRCVCLGGSEFICICSWIVISPHLPVEIPAAGSLAELPGSGHSSLSRSLCVSCLSRSVSVSLIYSLPTSETPGPVFLCLDLRMGLSVEQTFFRVSSFPLNVCVCVCVVPACVWDKKGMLCRPCWSPPNPCRELLSPEGEGQHSDPASPPSSLVVPGKLLRLTESGFVICKHSLS